MHKFDFFLGLIVVAVEVTALQGKIVFFELILELEVDYAIYRAFV